MNPQLTEAVGRIAAYFPGRSVKVEEQHWLWCLKSNPKPEHETRYCIYIEDVGSLTCDTLADAVTSALNTSPEEIKKKADELEAQANRLRQLVSALEPKEAVAQGRHFAKEPPLHDHADQSAVLCGDN